MVLSTWDVILFNTGPVWQLNFSSILLRCDLRSLCYTLVSLEGDAVQNRRLLAYLTYVQENCNLTMGLASVATLISWHSYLTS